METVIFLLFLGLIIAFGSFVFRTWDMLRMLKSNGPGISDISNIQTGTLIGMAFGFFIVLIGIALFVIEKTS